MKTFRRLRITILVLLVGVVPAFGQHLTTVEAAKHVGEHATVCGKIASEHTAFHVNGRPTFVNLDRPYPTQVFTVVVWEKDKANVGTIPSSGNVCVNGLITKHTGVPEIALHSTRDWSLEQELSSPPAQLSNNRYYTNSNDESVHSPAYSTAGVPAGATALCADGTYSFSRHRQGTCSHHGGVAKWLY